MARKILLADDSVTAQNMGRRILTDAGYEVTTVNNGSAALKRIAESKPDLIVLDVYMPGYGGLEVCQRIRESEETARIPVLLTVGKLEPFKAEEARRVRADAFVVKPFEASELLTALTKLEDKIVPPPQPHKPGRSVVPTAAIEQMSQGKQFGDLETGWKNRLKIPPPHAKPREDRLEDSEPQVEPVRSGRSESVAPPPKETAPERSGSSGMGDITPDEIAAITAAAAAFSSGSEEPFAKLVSAAENISRASQETEPEPVADAASAEMGATFASAPEVAAEAEKESSAMEPDAAVPASASASPIEAEVAEVAKDVVTEMPPPEIPATQEAASLPPADGATEKGKLGHEEVAAALATLHGHTEAFAGATETQAAPAMVAAASSQEFSGPRWVAETVALADDEAALILEQEMIKAQAAMAAAAESSSSPAAQFAVTPEENLSVPQAEDAFSPAAPFMGESSPSVLEEPQGTPSAAIVEESLADAVAVQAETSQVDDSIAEVKEEAFAASASAGAASESISNTDATSHTIAPAEAAEAAPLAPSPADHDRESELAAAWASWKQVRDSVASPQFTSQIADVAAAGLTDVPAAETASGPEAPAEVSASAPEENGAIASIVDSVLAELKPKLMEEIAKKIKKDK